MKFEAACLSVKLGVLDSQTEYRRLIAQQYDERINNPFIVLPVADAGSSHVWHVYTVLSEYRDELQAHLAAQGVRNLDPLPNPASPSNRLMWGLNEQSFPIASKIHERILSLPIGPTLTFEEASSVIDACNSFQPASL